MSLEQRFAYFTECQLATVEDLEYRARFPKGELQRHREIAEKMVATCREFDVKIPQAFGGPRCPRLSKLLTLEPNK
jgi:hypothetical protein